MLGFLISVLSTLEQQPVLDTALRDLLGNNLPKIALTRSSAERMDVAVSQFGNTLLFGLGGTAMDLLLRRVFANAQKAASHTAAYRWAEVARSLGIYSTMASVMWAMPFVRNYITTKKTGSLSFSDVIQSGGTPKAKTPAQQAALAANLQENKRKALVILGWGAAGVAVPAAFALWAGKTTLNTGKKVGEDLLEKLYHNKIAKSFVLEGGEFKKLAGIPSLLFWGLPAYFGWYQASRDAYEKQEVFIRAANFTFCFFGPGMISDNLLKKKFTEKFGLPDMSFAAVKASALSEAKQKAAQNFLKWKNLGSMGVSVALLGITPQLLNIYLTGRRLHDDQSQGKPSAGRPAAPPVPTLPPWMSQALMSPGQPQTKPWSPSVWPTGAAISGVGPLASAGAYGYPFPPVALGRPATFR